MDKLHVPVYGAMNLQVPDNGSVGIDLKTKDQVTLLPRADATVSTGVFLDMEPLVTFAKTRVSPFVTVFAKIEARSGLSSKGVETGAGVVDPSYQGELKVRLYNMRDTPITLEAGTRIAQFVTHVVLDPAAMSLSLHEGVLSEVKPSARGEAGFGSSDAQSAHK